MLDIAWPELAVIGAVALVAIGPKDLPKVMRTLGVWVRKARGFAQDFHSTIDRLGYEMEVAEKLKREESAHKAAEPKTSEQPSPPHHD